MNDISNKHTIQHPDDETQFFTNEDRSPSNDVIKHGDMVQGFQSPKQITQFPKWYQKPKRIIAFISVLIFVVLLLYQIIQFVLNVIAE
jgi:hypothetical protein